MARRASGSPGQALPSGLRPPAGTAGSLGRGWVPSSGRPGETRPAPWTRQRACCGRIYGAGSWLESGQKVTLQGAGQAGCAQEGSRVPRCRPRTGTRPAAGAAPARPGLAVGAGCRQGTAGCAGLRRPQRSAHPRIVPPPCLPVSLLGAVHRGALVLRARRLLACAGGAGARQQSQGRSAGAGTGAVAAACCCCRVLAQGPGRGWTPLDSSAQTMEQRAGGMGGRRARLGGRLVGVGAAGSGAGPGRPAGAGARAAGGAPGAGCANGFHLDGHIEEERHVGLRGRCRQGGAPGAEASGFVQEQCT